MDRPPRLPASRDGRRGARQEPLQHPDVDPHRRPCARAPRAEGGHRRRMPERLRRLPLRRQASHLLRPARHSASRVLDRLHRENADFGRELAIDASDMPAYANGQRYLSKNGPERERYSDPGASWGHRSAVSTRKGGGFYGYRVHAAVCARPDLPVAWQVETAGSHEPNYVAPLLDTTPLARLRRRDGGARHGLRQRTGLRRVRGPRHPADHPAPKDCRCRARRSSPADLRARRVAVRRGRSRRAAAKWRCPTGECKPASRWGKADRLHPLVPRESKRWKSLYLRAGLCRARVRQAQE